VFHELRHTSDAVLCLRTSEGEEPQPSKLVVRVRFPSPPPLVRVRFRRSSRERHPLDARHDFPSLCPPPGVVAPAAAAWTFDLSHLSLP
jgi:hypothetical protein